MKILMFGWEFPPHITGGLGTACYGLTRGLANHDVDICFVVPKAWGDEDSAAVRLVDAGDIEVDANDEMWQKFWRKVTYLEIGSGLVPYVTPEAFRQMAEASNPDGVEERVLKTRFSFSGKYGNDLLAEVSRYALIASGLAQQNAFDIIHAHDWLTFPAGIAAKKVSGKPLIVHIHATEFDRSGKNINPDIYEIEKKGFEAADRIIAVSNMTRDVVIQKYHIAPEKIITVHNAIEEASAASRIPERHVSEKIVTFMGRLTRQKGPEYFVEAAHLILRHHKNVRFVMAGTGDLLDTLVRRVAQLGMGIKFHFTGFLKGEEVERMFRLSDVFVMPSVSEPFGLVPLEAMQCGVPVVISRQSGVSEILNNVLKVDFWDINGLADAIYGLLNYRAIAEEFKKAGKLEADGVQWDKAAGEVMAIYQNIMNRC
jgi:glycosyltransferase involved in cell wall biosynthesis